MSEPPTDDEQAGALYGCALAALLAAAGVALATWWVAT